MTFIFVNELYNRSTYISWYLYLFPYELDKTINNSINITRPILYLFFFYDVDRKCELRVNRRYTLHRVKISK